MNENQSSTHHDEIIPPRFRFWRRVHRGSSFTLGIFGLVHSMFTSVGYSTWDPDPLWFLGTGLGLLLLAVMNIVHIGIMPCTQPTAPAVRWSNWGFLVFGVSAVFAVPQAHTFMIVLVLFIQAMAGESTLRVPAATS